MTVLCLAAEVRSLKAQTASTDEDESMFEVEHVSPPALDGLEDNALAQAKLVEALHTLQQLRPSTIKDHDRAVRGLQEVLAIVSDSAESEMLGPIDWRKFGERLRVRRLAAGHTQDTLGAKVGVTGTTIRALELHKRKARRGLMLRLLAVPDLNLRVSDIELSAERSAGSRWTPTSWLGATYDPIGMITDLADTLNSSSGQLEQTYVYVDTQSAKDWIATSSTPEYDAANRSPVPLEPMAKRIAETIGEHALSTTVLGCGDGRTEARLLTELEQHLRLPAQSEVFLLDISHALLNTAYRHFRETLPNLTTYTVHGNFLELPRLPMLVGSLRGRRRLHVMLGYTLVNLNDELRYFRDILNCCPTGDLFLCDVNIALAPAADREQIKRIDPIATGKVRSSHATWLSGIIRRYCNGADQIKLHTELAPLGGIPGSYGFDLIATVKMRDGQPDRRFLMQRLRRYDPKQLTDCLAELGWKTIERIDYGTGGKKTMSLLLLQKQ